MCLFTLYNNRLNSARYFYITILPSQPPAIMPIHRHSGDSRNASCRPQYIYLQILFIAHIALYSHLRPFQLPSGNHPHRHSAPLLRRSLSHSAERYLAHVCRYLAFIADSLHALFRRLLMLLCHSSILAHTSEIITRFYHHNCSSCKAP